MSCNGICVRYRASNNYANGQKRCQICEQFVKWDGLWCPCCSCRLRLAPRLFKHKAKLREQKHVSDAKEVKVLHYYLPSA